MKMHFSYGWLNLLFFSLISPSFADSTELSNVVTIAGYDIPKMVETSEKGLFVELINEAGRRAGYQVKVNVLPAKRAVVQFRKGLYDGMFPMTGTFRPVIEGPRTHTMYIKRTFAFVREGADIPTSIDELKNYTVGLNAQYDNDERLLNNDQIKFVWGNDDIAMMKMLAAQRFYTFIVEERSGLKALKNANVNNITYNSDYPLTETEAYVLFQNTDRGELIALNISRAMAQMKADGSFARIMRLGH